MEDTVGWRRRSLGGSHRVQRTLKALESLCLVGVGGSRLRPLRPAGAQPPAAPSALYCSLSLGVSSLPFCSCTAPPGGQVWLGLSQPLSLLVIGFGWSWSALLWPHRPFSAILVLMGLGRGGQPGRCRPLVKAQETSKKKEGLWE